MKYKVVKVFRDKETKERRRVGEVIEYAEERAKEIMDKGKYIEPLEEAKEPVKKTRKPVAKKEN